MRNIRVKLIILSTIILSIYLGFILPNTSRENISPNTEENVPSFIDSISNRCSNVDRVTYSIKDGVSCIYIKTKYSVKEQPIYINFIVHTRMKYIMVKRIKNPFVYYLTPYDLMAIPNGFGKVFYSNDQEMVNIITDYTNYIIRYMVDNYNIVNNSINK